MFAVTNLAFSYGKKEILAGVSLQIDQPSIVGVVAPNGTGKSTLLNILNGTLTGFSGEYSYRGVPYSHKQRRNFSQQVVKMPDQQDLYNELTGRDHLALYTMLWNSDNCKIQETIDRLNMGHYVDQRVDSYSLGMRQRLTFAMCLVTNAEVYLLDEVMNSLDPSNVELITTVLKEMRDNGNIIFIVSHMLDNIEEVADRIVFLKDKRFFLSYEPNQPNQQTVEVYFYPKVSHAKRRAFCEKQGYPWRSIDDEVFWFDVETWSRAELEALVKALVFERDYIGKVTVGRKACHLFYRELYMMGG